VLATKEDKQDLCLC